MRNIPLPADSAAANLSRPIEPVSRFERAKLLHDYFKHLTTVSTASVVFIVTFHEKFPDTAPQKGLIAASIVAFLVCVVCSVGAQTAYIWYASSDPRREGKLVYLVGRTGSWIAFFAGVICLVAFALFRLSS